MSNSIPGSPAGSSASTSGASGSVPDARGRYGRYGGVYVPETLVGALTQLGEVYAQVKGEPAFWLRLEDLLKHYVGRPTPLQKADRLTAHVRERVGASGGGSGGGSGAGKGAGRGATIWLKREDLAHTGAHKINNTMGQALLTLRMGKGRIIAETGAGQHGVASATAAAHFGLKCEVYMGSEDARRQRLNVVRMRMLGAKVIEVDSGSRTLKDATNEAMRDWMGSVQDTHYVLGSVVGPHPFPMIVRDFQSVIGKETRAQCMERFGMPDCIVACVGGGSNAAGIFHPFIEDDVALIGVEAGGRSPTLGDHAAPLARGAPGVLHGSMSYVMQDAFGQTADVHSCSAGLDYPGVGPEHAYWKDSGRVRYTECSDAEALEAFTLLARTEGIIPALETAHAVAQAVRMAGEMPAGANVVVNVSGRGDKDVEEAARLLSLRDGR